MRTSTDDEVLRNVLNDVQDLGVSTKTSARAQNKDIWSLPGFTGKSRVSTSFGELPIEALRRRDNLLTLDGRFLPVERIDQVLLDEGFLRRHPEARPVLIRSRSMGRGTPSTDIWVSRQQRVQDPNSPRETKKVIDLSGPPHMMPDLKDSVTYYLFDCGKPAMVRVEHVWCLTAPIPDVTRC